MQKDWCALLHYSLVLVLLFFVFLEDVSSSFFGLLSYLINFFYVYVLEKRYTRITDSPNQIDGQEKDMIFIDLPQEFYLCDAVN